MQQKHSYKTPFNRISIHLALVIFGAGMCFSLCLPATAHGLDANEIIARMEANQTQSTSIISGRMIIRDRFGERSSSYTAWSQGSELFLVEFTSTMEQGQKILRRDNSLYLYFPDARETIRLQGAALRDSLLGSDVSYEDMTGGRGLADTYTFELLGQETIGDSSCHKIELNAKEANVAYPKQIYWVDIQDFVVRKSEQYARSGRLLKTTEVMETSRIAGYHFPTRISIKDETRRSSGTEMIIENAELDVELPSDTFSLDRLTW